MARRSAKRRSTSRRRILQASGMAIDGGGYPSVVPYFHPGPNKKRTRTYPPRYAPPPPPPRPPAKAFVRPQSKRPLVQQVTAGSTRTFVNAMVRYKGRPKPHHLNKLYASARQEIVRQGTFNFSSTLGTQKHYEMPLMDMEKDLNTNSSVTTVDRELSQVFYIAARAPRSIADQDVANQTPLITLSEEFMKKQRVYLKHQRMQFKCVNTTNAPIKMVIRVFGIKRDTDYSLIEYWKRCARNADNADTAVDTVVGFPPYNMVLTDDMPDATPIGLPNFDRLFYELDKHVVDMDAGAEHKHYYHAEYSRPVKGADLFTPGYVNESGIADEDNTTINTNYLAQFTKYITFTVLGPKVQSNLTNVQSYGPGQLSVWFNSSTVFYNYPVPVASTKYYYNSISRTTPAGETFQAQDNEDAGEAAFAPSVI